MKKPIVAAVSTPRSSETISETQSKTLISAKKPVATPVDTKPRTIIASTPKISVKTPAKRPPRIKTASPKELPVDDYFLHLNIMNLSETTILVSKIV